MGWTTFSITPGGVCVPSSHSPTSPSVTLSHPPSDTQEDPSLSSIYRLHHARPRHLPPRSPAHLRHEPLLNNAHQRDLRSPSPPRPWNLHPHRLRRSRDALRLRLRLQRLKSRSARLLQHPPRRNGALRCQGPYRRDRGREE